MFHALNKFSKPTLCLSRMKTARSFRNLQSFCCFWYQPFWALQFQLFFKLLILSRFAPCFCHFRKPKNGTMQQKYARGNEYLLAGVLVSSWHSLYMELETTDGTLILKPEAIPFSSFVMIVLNCFGYKAWLCNLRQPGISETSSWPCLRTRGSLHITSLRTKSAKVLRHIFVLRMKHFPIFCNTTLCSCTTNICKL